MVDFTGSATISSARTTSPASRGSPCISFRSGRRAACVRSGTPRPPMDARFSCRTDRENTDSPTLVPANHRKSKPKRFGPPLALLRARDDLRHWNEIMNESTADSRFEGPRDRRKRLRRSSDREMLAQLSREKGCCAEIGCHESVWLGSRFCIWHPRLRLARQTETRRSQPSPQIRG